MKSNPNTRRSIGAGPEDESINRLLAALKSDAVLAYDPESGVYDRNEETHQNGVEIDNGDFGAGPEDESINRLLVALKNDAVLAYDPESGVYDRNEETHQNGVEIDNGDFGAISTDQWYYKDPLLFRTEVEIMTRRFPHAKCGFLENGAMIWRLKLNLGTGLKPWEVVLMYDKDHPHNNGYGGSVHVLPITPSYQTLEQRAKAAGYRGVPHMLPGTEIEGVNYPYLCTRLPEGVKDGKRFVSSAMQAVTWAVDWALNFEMSMLDAGVWNKWVNDSHYSSWRVPV